MATLGRRLIVQHLDTPLKCCNRELRPGAKNCPVCRKPTPVAIQYVPCPLCGTWQDLLTNLDILQVDHVHPGCDMCGATQLADLPLQVASMNNRNGYRMQLSFMGDSVDTSDRTAVMLVNLLLRQAVLVAQFSVENLTGFDEMLSNFGQGTTGPYKQTSFDQLLTLACQNVDALLGIDENGRQNIRRPSLSNNSKSLNKFGDRRINTGGGAYIGGTVQITGSGNIVGRDNISIVHTGPGAIANGPGAVAVGAGGVAIGGSYRGDINTGNPAKVSLRLNDAPKRARNQEAYIEMQWDDLEGIPVGKRANNPTAHDVYLQVLAKAVEFNLDNDYIIPLNIGQMIAESILWRLPSLISLVNTELNSGGKSTAKLERHGARLYLYLRRLSQVGSPTDQLAQTELINSAIEVALRYLTRMLVKYNAEYDETSGKGRGYAAMADDIRKDTVEMAQQIKVILRIAPWGMNNVNSQVWNLVSQYSK
jgi:hypothetical protein